MREGEREEEGGDAWAMMGYRRRYALAKFGDTETDVERGRLGEGYYCSLHNPAYN